MRGNSAGRSGTKASRFWKLNTSLPMSRSAVRSGTKAISLLETQCIAPYESLCRSLGN
ncbi:hypothetical protein MAL08_12915 [Leptospira noguchii]|uniref:hypothetical protein n=1 Tax=Leptospira noguchii TaxID=28182 RepID=UPI001FB5A5F5|nr:hypothetical protein [Leptospira noguchii]UOG36989.1 hypothetical protein MAL08_12915 [Leptospira noguchii]